MFYELIVFKLFFVLFSVRGWVSLHIAAVMESKMSGFSRDSVGRRSSCLLCPYQGTDPELRPPVTEGAHKKTPENSVKAFLLVFHSSLHAHRVYVYVCSLVRKLLDLILAG